MRVIVGTKINPKNRVQNCKQIHIMCLKGETPMKHSKEQVNRWVRLVQLMHAFNPSIFAPEEIAQLEAVEGWKWETFTCSKPEALLEATILARQVFGLSVHHRNGLGIDELRIRDCIPYGLSWVI
jgi:hypothetical protein